MVRNFWVDADVDGRKTMLGSGPRSKDGGMKVTIYQREEGCITTAVNIFCYEVNGKLYTNVSAGGKVIAQITTKR